MDALDYWRLCDELSIVQAALLIAGEDPGHTGPRTERWDPQNKPVGYEAAKTAISGALRRSEIEGVLVPEYEQAWNQQCEEIKGSVDPEKSIIQRASLTKW